MSKAFLIPAGILAAILIILGSLYFSLRHTEYNEEGAPEAVITPNIPSNVPAVFVPSNSSVATSTAGNEAPLIYAVVTDKQSYKQDEPISIYLSIANVSKKAKEFSFKDGCMGSYTIAGFDSAAHTRCLPNATMFTLPPGELRQIKLVHYPSIEKLPVGTHTLRAYVIGYGGWSTDVTITK